MKFLNDRYRQEHELQHRLREAQHAFNDALHSGSSDLHARMGELEQVARAIVQARSLPEAYICVACRKEKPIGAQAIIEPRAIVIDYGDERPSVRLYFEEDVKHYLPLCIGCAEAMRLIEHVSVE